MIKPDLDGFEITVEQTTHVNGLQLLEETFNLFGSFVKEHPKGFNIVLDEFQEIANLPDSIKIEGILRSQIQTHVNAGYFFVGSRRRMLLDIFNELKRPFYKSAINYTHWGRFQKPKLPPSSLTGSMMVGKSVLPMSLRLYTIKQRAIHTMSSEFPMRYLPSRTGRRLPLRIMKKP